MICTASCKKVWNYYNDVAQKCVACHTHNRLWNGLPSFAYATDDWRMFRYLCGYLKARSQSMRHCNYDLICEDFASKIDEHLAFKTPYRTQRSLPTVGINSTTNNKIWGLWWSMWASQNKLRIQFHSRKSVTVWYCQYLHFKALASAIQI